MCGDGEGCAGVGGVVLEEEAVKGTGLDDVDEFVEDGLELDSPSEKAGIGGG